jgi:hypothetical protein
MNLIKMKERTSKVIKKMNISDEYLNLKDWTPYLL